MKKKVCVLFLFVALALFFAQSQVEAATLNKKKVELSVGKTATLTLKNANGTVKWTSGNSKICKVKNGKLRQIEQAIKRERYQIDMRKFEKHLREICLRFYFDKAGYKFIEQDKSIIGVPIEFYCDERKGTI